MKTPLLRTLVLLVLTFALLFSMTGCEDLDYREGIRLYNAGKFEDAADIFSALGNFENCPELYTDCQYWIAANLAEEGDFEKALPRFLKLGNYRNSTQWVTECKYQMAVTALNEEQYEDARNYFAETPDYKNTPEYLRRLNWIAMYDTIANVGFNDGSGFILEISVDAKQFSIRANDYSHELELSVSEGRNGDFFFHDSLEITLTRDSTVALFDCGSGFGMDYLDSSIGSSQTATGKIDITTCTPETKLVMETFEMHVEDNQGKITDSKDPADSLMDDAMAENLSDLLTTIPKLLLDSGITVTLQDIGFYAL